MGQDRMSHGLETTMAKTTLRHLEALRILPRRILLETPGVEATVPMLRGVWGAALHDLDPEAYGVVFQPRERGPGDPGPSYILRPAAPDPAFAPALEWILIGPALRYRRSLERAWDVASGMGLGRDRCPFHLRRIVAMLPDGRSHEEVLAGWEPREPESEAGWTLDRVELPWEEAAATPCRLHFPAPLRLRRHGRLLNTPTLSDITANLTRRIAQFLPEEERTAWEGHARELLEVSRAVSARPWRGERRDLHRYSASQRAELDLHGVVGYIDLPSGPGGLWPLLAASQWVHVGKSAVLGLGHVEIVRLPGQA